METIGSVVSLLAATLYQGNLWHCWSCFLIKMSKVIVLVLVAHQLRYCKFLRKI